MPRCGPPRRAGATGRGPRPASFLPVRPARRRARPRCGPGPPPRARRGPSCARPPRTAPPTREARWRPARRGRRRRGRRNGWLRPTFRAPVVVPARWRILRLAGHGEKARPPHLRPPTASRVIPRGGGRGLHSRTFRRGARLLQSGFRGRGRARGKVLVRAAFRRRHRPTRGAGRPGGPRASHPG